MQISLGGADVRGRPNHNAGNREGGAGGRNMARAGTGDRCGAVGGLGWSGPGTAGLADSGRAAPMAKAVPGGGPDGDDTGGLGGSTRNSPTRRPCCSVNFGSRKECEGREWIWENWGGGHGDIVRA
jgi:hypothetical protein